MKTIFSQHNKLHLLLLLIVIILLVIGVFNYYLHNSSGIPIPIIYMPFFIIIGIIIILSIIKSALNRIVFEDDKIIIWNNFRKYVAEKGNVQYTEDNNFFTINMSNKKFIYSKNFWGMTSKFGKETESKLKELLSEYSNQNNI